MDFYDAVKARRSVRAYKPDQISAESTARLALSVSEAPSACNLQPFKFLFVSNPALRAKIASVYTRDWLKQAPAIVVALGNAKTAWKRLEGDSIVDVDVAIAMEHFVLAAAAEGLGTCWICAYDRAALDSALSIEAPWRSVAISPVGYPSDSAKPRTRKPLSDIFQELP